MRMPDESAASSHAFQVDLRGLVDLLSQHLYSSPRVYVRELLQNAVDATTARRQLAAGAPTAIRITLSDEGLSITDSGIGLTEAEAHRFLATIGSSSKRDEIEGARREFLGQFGIGLLACFTVAERIQVITRSARDPGAPTIEWLASSDGTYRVSDVSARAPRAEPGTTVRLTPRPGSERWLAPHQVASLAREYGALLPYEVTVSSPDETVRTTEHPAAWDRPYASGNDRRAALAGYARGQLGFDPLDVIDLDVPLAGIRGAGFVLPQPANPVEGGRHRVYLKGMLLSDAATGLLPEWAFFVRCVIDTDALRPTASREGLYQDETLAAVREHLGGQVREWLTTLAAEDPRRLDAFLAVHSLGVKALATHDRELARIMLPHLRFETTDGQVSLAEFTRAHPRLYLAQSVEEFRQVATIASAQGIGVVNGGYTYDAEIVGLVPQIMQGVTVEPLDAGVIATALDPVAPGDELAFAPVLAAARAALGPLDCDVILRAFRPVTVPALYLDSRAARAERTRAELAARADDLWADILGALRSTAPRAQLVLNHHSPLIRRLARISDSPLLTAAVESLYGHALLMTHRPLRAADSALLNRAFGELLRHATRDAGRSGAATDGDDIR
jgi:molecular chaperone HtpG